MARKQVQQFGVKEYPYPSLYGSHRSMVIEDKEMNVVCQDEFGTYLTERNRLDNGLADPNRYLTRRLSKFFSGENKHDISSG